MKITHLLISLCAFLSLLLSGCGDPAAEALAPLSQATLTAGKGMGDLELGKTTLSEVATKYGSGLISIAYGDETMIEMTYLRSQVSFGFLLCCKCKEDPEAIKHLGQDLEAFFAQHPSCRDLPLTSVSVGLSGSEPADAFFQGATEKGVKLGAPLSEAKVYGDEAGPSPGFIAGQSARNTDPAVDGEGIRVYRETNGDRVSRITVFKTSP